MIHGIDVPVFRHMKRGCRRKCAPSGAPSSILRHAVILVGGMTDRRRPGTEWQVVDADAGMRLDAFLAVEGRAGSRGRATRAITRGQVFLNDREATTADAGQRLAARDRVRLGSIGPGPRPGDRVSGQWARSRSSDEDTALLVINKPAGLLSVPLPRKAEEPAVTDYLERHLRSRGNNNPRSFIGSTATRRGCSSSRGQAPRRAC